MMEFRYFRPKSLTWWAGALMILMGVAMLIWPEAGRLSSVGSVVGVLAGSGDSSPAGLIGVGVGLIGLGDKVERKLGIGEE